MSRVYKSTLFENWFSWFNYYLSTHFFEANIVDIGGDYYFKPQIILLLIFHRKWKDWQNFWKLKTLHCGLNFRTCLLLLFLLTKCSSGNSKMWLCQSFAPLQHSLALIPDGGMIQLKFLSVFSENLFSYFVNSSSDLCLFQINVGRRCFNFLMSSALYRRKQAKEENEIKTKYIPSCVQNQK